MVDPQEVENRIEKLTEINAKCLEEISRVCLDIHKEYGEEFGDGEMAAIAIRSSLTFAVSSMIAIGISEENAHEILNEFYTGLNETLENALKQ